MSYTKYQPVFLDLNGRLCVVVGGGKIAHDKLVPLLEAGAQVRIVSPTLCPSTAHLLQVSGSEVSQIEWRQKEFEERDLEGAFLVIGATEDPTVNRQVFSLAESHGKLANAVDDPANCNFIFGAVAKAGPIQVAVSSAGCSPVIAQRVRNQVKEAILSEGLGDLAEFLGEWRPAVKESIESYEDRKLFWQQVLDSRIPQLLADGEITMAREEMTILLLTWGLCHSERSACPTSTEEDTPRLPISSELLKESA